MLFLEFQKTNYLVDKEAEVMERKYIKKVFFALALMPSMVAEAKTKLEVKNKTVTIGNTYQMKLKGVSGKAKVRWKTSNKSVVSIAKRWYEERSKGLED